jgi:hypothetical protein
MAKVEWNDAIKTVSGALTKINKKSPHAADQKMILATHRVAETTNIGSCNRLYVRGLNSVTRSTPVTSTELEARTKFAQIAQMVNQRKNNLTTLSTDQAAYAAQKDEPGGKKTWKSYLWKVCKEAYEESSH